MKKAIFGGVLVALVTPAFSYDNSYRQAECFLVEDINETNQCMITSGGGVALGGSYIALQFNGKHYLIEQSMACGGKCKPYLGTIPEDVLEAKKYFREYKTKNAVTHSKKMDWTCYKQNKGEIDICYTFKD